MVGTEQTPTRIDFEPGVYGLDYETKGRYLGEVYSQKWGNGPTCIYEEGDKIYKLTSGLVDGLQVEGKYFVYELNLRESGLSIAELRNTETMRRVIEENKGRITKTQLEIGKDYRIVRGILHQPCGKGILRIEVPSGYEEDKMIETDKASLSDYFEDKS